MWPDFLYMLELWDTHIWDWQQDSTCAYSFSQSGVPTSCSRIHIEQKPSSSDKCGILFTIRVDFGRHKNDTHTQAKEVITSATNVTGLSLHVGTLRHILSIFTRRFHLNYFFS